MIYSFQSPDAIAGDVEQAALAAVVADRRTGPEPVSLPRHGRGSAGLVVSLTGTAEVESVAGLGQRARRVPAHCRRAWGGAADSHQRHHRAPQTAGDQDDVLERTVFSVTSGEEATADAPPEFAYWQFGGIGVCQLIAGIYHGRRVAMLERFTVDGWVDAVRRHRVARSGVQPAVIRMLLDADVPEGGSGLPGIPDQCLGAAGPRDPRRVRE